MNWEKKLILGGFFFRNFFVFFKHSRHFTILFPYQSTLILNQMKYSVITKKPVRALRQNLHRTKSSKSLHNKYKDTDDKKKKNFTVLRHNSAMNSNHLNKIINYVLKYKTSYTL